MFVTKIDKSYRVQCFYAETARTVTQNLNVSPAHNLHGETLTATVPLPECKYQVLSEGKNGTPLKFASVGQQVYHEWTCDPDGKLADDSSFCATVHSCNVKEDGGREVQLLDENGCAVDRYLLNNLEYTSDLSGGQVSQVAFPVFKFADQPSLFFQCQIRITIKDGSVCKRTSDDCPRTLRGKRSSESEDDNNVDVVSQYMTVFDIDDTSTDLSFLLDPLSVRQSSNGDICVSPLAAGSLLSVFASSLLVCVVCLATMNRRGITHVKLHD
ncbi:unnamed protein product [Cylicostephanus goldi]|uniref:ZP domain-containing protein n=1 Tax=Cylicostephanus goldi TaxID=71465 RepID=A0A3P6PVD5_CYLGO|nr:unnamed protein product [Cylicostephanus goldi]